MPVRLANRPEAVPADMIAPFKAVPRFAFGNAIMSATAEEDIISGIARIADCSRNDWSLRSLVDWRMP